MRFTNQLFAQHIGWTFKKHWQVQGLRNPRNDFSVKELEKKGFQIKSPRNVLNSKPKLSQIELEEFQNEIYKKEYSSKLHHTVCHSYNDNNVLLEGMPQAQMLTNTIEINRLPERILSAVTELQLSKTVDRRIQSLIMQANVFDSEQVKLPKLKLDHRPAFNFPRQYGISNERKNFLLINKLIAQCEKLSDPSVTAQRRLIDNAFFKSTFTKGSDVLQFMISAKKFLTTARPLISVKGKFDGSLPDLHPLKSTIALSKAHSYIEESLYPFNDSIRCGHPHTLFIHSNNEMIENISHLSVSATQLHSRSLLAAFTAALARAKQIYGVDVKQLPLPIVVQSIQSDGRSFHFGLFQLNTLDLDSESLLKNYWFHIPNVDLFSKCGYKNGRPFLDGYNTDVFRILHAFYNNS